MQKVSAAFLAAMAKSHTISTSITLATFLGVKSSGPIAVVTGSVDIDKTAVIRRSASLTIVDTTGALVPAAPGDKLSPFGNEVSLQRGIKYPDNSIELVPLGVFWISTTDIDDTGQDLVISIKGYDRSRAVSRYWLTDAYTIAAGTNVATAIKNLINSRVPNLSYNFAITAQTTPNVIHYTPGTDPWVAARDLASAIGMDLYFDVAGTCVLTPEPDPTTAAVVADYTEKAGLGFTSLKRSLSDEHCFNDVIESGESTGLAAPVSGRAQDLNPSSATYVNGPYGDVPVFHTSPLYTSNAQALAAAQAKLKRNLGQVESVTLHAIPHPALDVADVITVTRARLRMDKTRFMIEHLSIPLNAHEDMTATLQRVA